MAMLSSRVAPGRAAFPFANPRPSNHSGHSSPGATASAVSDKLGLTRARKPLGEANGQRRGTVDRKVVEPDEADHPPVEPRLEDVVSVASLAGLWIQGHAPHVISGATPSLRVFAGPPGQQVTGLKVPGVRPAAAVEVYELRAEEEHHRPGQ